MLLRQSRILSHMSWCVLALLIWQSRLQAQTPGPLIPRKLTLADAERILLDRNLAVVAAKYQVEASRAAKLVASYKPNPVLTVGMEQVALSSPFFSRLVHTDPSAAAQSTYTLRLDKIIERGGKRELRTQQAEEQLQANEALMLDAMRTQLFQLRQSFTAATLARENLLLAEATLNQYEQTEKLTVVKVETGDLPGVEVYRAHAGRLQFEQAVVQARTAYEQASRDVLNLLGASVADVAAPARQTAAADLPTPGAQLVPARYDVPSVDPQVLPQFSAALTNAPLEIVARFEDRPVPQTLAELRAIALRERPDVVAARHVLAASQHGFTLAERQRVRDVSVGTEYQRVGADNALGVTMSVPLFVYNNQRSSIAQAEAQRKASETLLQQAELQATTDVEKAYQAYLAARRTLDLYGAQNLVQVEKLRNIAALSYKEGASSLFELLDAQRTYNAALTAYNQARADYQNALWQLESATNSPLH